MGLGYPGGPALSKLAEQGDPAAFKLPRPLLHSGNLDFSFAGLKTAVMTQAKKLGDAFEERKADLAASTEAAIVEVLLKKSLTALRDTGLKRLVVAGGEIGLDFFVPELCQSPLRERQTYFYLAQLRLARKHGLPVILHVRRSADQLLKGLRSVAAQSGAPWQGIAHAFNGSEQQAQSFLSLGFKLGFGGALTYERALQLRRLASTLPLDAIVMETDAPDMPPHWTRVSNTPVTRWRWVCPSTSCHRPARPTPAGVLSASWPPGVR